MNEIISAALLRSGVALLALAILALAATLRRRNRLPTQ
jgi:hypothetical protein